MVPDFVQHGAAAPIEYGRLIRMLDAEMLESVGLPVPFDDPDDEVEEEATKFTSSTRRLVPIVSVGLALSAVSVLILAHFSGM